VWIPPTDDFLERRGFPFAFAPVIDYCADVLFLDLFSSLPPPPNSIETTHYYNFPMEDFPLSEKRFLFFSMFPKPHSLLSTGYILAFPPFLPCFCYLFFPVSLSRCFALPLCGTGFFFFLIPGSFFARNSVPPSLHSLLPCLVVELDGDPD